MYSISWVEFCEKGYSATLRYQRHRLKTVAKIAKPAWAGCVVKL